MTAPRPWPLSITQWTLREPDYERALARIAASGADGAELFADPDGPPAAELDRLLRDAGIGAPSLCGMWSEDRDCAHPEAAARERATTSLRRCLELGGEIGARTLVCVPTYRPEPLAARDDELRWAAEAIGEAVRAVPGGPTLVVEPLNRYETHLIRTLADAERLRAEIGADGVAIMGDTFHMTLEERSPVAALREHAATLAHVHFADSNRREPGAGILDFGAILAELGRIGFAGTTAIEIDPATDAALAAGVAHVDAALGAGARTSEG